MPEKFAEAEELRSASDANGPSAPEAGNAPGGQPYTLRSHILGSSDESLTRRWKAFQQMHSPDDPMQDPDWLKGYFEGQTDNLRFYSLHSGDRLCGLVPFLRRDWPMALHLGPWRLAEFPLTRLRLLGSKLNLPDDDRAYDLLFTELARPDSDYDTLFLEDVPLDSYLWCYLHRSQLIRSAFLPYEPDAPSPRLLLRFEGSFDQYLSKFSAKHRKNLLREVKKLRDGALGEMRFVRFDSPEHVPLFLEKAFEVSRRTYQWALYQRGLSATDLIAARVKFAAAGGWLRSYLLLCGERACAFVLGFQYCGRFLLHEIGFDPDLAKHSVGTASLLLTVEDLFNAKPPHVLDFEAYGKYKESLSTESYLQGKLFLFRPNAYNRVLRAGHKSSAFTSALLSSLFERLNLKNKLRRRLRQVSVPSSSVPSKGVQAQPESKAASSHREPRGSGGPPPPQQTPSAGGTGGAIRKLGRLLRQRGLAATVGFVVSRLFRYEVHRVYEAALQDLCPPPEWQGNQSLQWFDAESLTAAMTPKLLEFLGGEAAYENLEGVRGGDELYIAAASPPPSSGGPQYLHRGYILFNTRAKKLIAETEATPLIAYCFTAPGARGRGLYRRALAEVLWRLKSLGYRRAIIQVHPGNLPSIKGIESAGFSRPREIRLWILLNSLVIRRMQDRDGKQWRAFFV